MSLCAVMVFYYNLFDGDSEKKETVGGLNESCIIENRIQWISIHFMYEKFQRVVELTTIQLRS